MAGLYFARLEQYLGQVRKYSLSLTIRPRRTGAGRAHRGNGCDRPFCVYGVCFFFRGPLGFEVGFRSTPFRKQVLSYRSKKTSNPNPSPIRNGFGLHESGARGGT